MSNGTKAQYQAVNRYVKNHYDSITVTMPKGKKDIIKQSANRRNMSVNSFINSAIDKMINSENEA